MTGGDDRRIRERIHEFLIRRAVNTKARLGRFLRPGSFLILLLSRAAGAGALLRDFDVPDASFWRSGGPQPSHSQSSLHCRTSATAPSSTGISAYSRTLPRTRGCTPSCRDVAALVERETDLRAGQHSASMYGRFEVYAASGAWSDEFVRARGSPVLRYYLAERERRPRTVLGVGQPDPRRPRAALEVLNREGLRITSAQQPLRLHTWHEAMSTQHYTAVLAWPLHGGQENARRVVGVMSVDVQAAGGRRTAREGADEPPRRSGRSSRGVRGDPPEGVVSGTAFRLLWVHTPSAGGHVAKDQQSGSGNGFSRVVKSDEATHGEGDDRDRPSARALRLV